MSSGNAQTLGLKLQRVVSRGQNDVFGFDVQLSKRWGANLIDDTESPSQRRDNTIIEAGVLARRNARHLERRRTDLPLPHGGARCEPVGAVFRGGPEPALRDDTARLSAATAPVATPLTQQISVLAEAHHLCCKEQTSGELKMFVCGVDESIDVLVLPLVLQNTQPRAQQIQPVFKLGRIVEVSHMCRPKLPAFENRLQPFRCGVVVQLFDVGKCLVVACPKTVLNSKKVFVQLDVRCVGIVGRRLFGHDFLSWSHSVPQSPGILAPSPWLATPSRSG